MTQSTETTARTPAQIKAIRRSYGLNTAADAKKAARVKAIRKGYVDRKIKVAIETKIAEGKKVARERHIAAYYAARKAA